MEGLNNLLSISADGLESLFTQLSQVLGIGVEFIRENAMYYILEYGRYQVVTKALSSVILWSVIFSFLFWMIFVIANSNEEELKVISNKFKKTIKLYLIFLITLVITVMIISSVKYFASPEIYSIKQIMQLLK